MSVLVRILTRPSVLWSLFFRFVTPVLLWMNCCCTKYCSFNFWTDMLHSTIRKKGWIIILRLFCQIKFQCLFQHCLCYYISCQIFQTASPIYCDRIKTTNFLRTLDISGLMIPTSMMSVKIVVTTYHLQCSLEIQVNLKWLHPAVGISDNIS